jgi:broad specificity phosphatase PhoE
LRWFRRLSILFKGLFNIFPSYVCHRTNQEAALSAKGVAQVEAACRFLKENHIELTGGRYSLAASAMDSATIVIRELKLGRERLIAEYTFMDPRAVGQWDMLNWRDTEAAVWAMDALEAGSSGTGARPPPNEDSTPNETLADQAVRLRQLLSGTTGVEICEKVSPLFIRSLTRYLRLSFGDSVFW